MKQVLIGGTTAALTTSGNYWGSVYAGYGLVSVQAQRHQLIAAPGKLRKLKVDLSTAPGVGATRTWTLYVNGVATALAATVTGAATYGEDVTNEVTVAPGDYIVFYISLTGSPAAALPRWSLEFEGDNAAESILLSCGQSASVGTYYTSAHCGYSVEDTGENSYLQIIPCPGKIRDFYVQQTVAPGAGKTITHALRVNAATSALSVPISGTSKTGNDTTNEVTVAAGDRISIIKTCTAGSTAPDRVSYGMTFVADTDGESPIPSGLGDYPSSTAANLTQLAEGYVLQAYTALPTADKQRSDAQKLYNFYARSHVAPGAGKSYRLQIRKNGVATALDITISGTAQTANITGTEVEFADGDTLSILCTPSGTPAGAFIAWGVTQYILVAGAKCYGLHPGAMAEMLS